MNDFRAINKEQFIFKVNLCLEKLINLGMSQTEIGNFLGITDRTIRNWQNFNSCPNGLQFYNLVKLCKNKKA